MNETQEALTSLPRWLESAPVERVVRIDIGLEGSWSDTVRPVWSRAVGFLGFAQAPHSHSEHRPALELYFDDGWIGLPCFKVHDGMNVLDETRARQLIEYVASRQTA